MVYNFTGLENNTNVYDLFVVVNTASNELYVAMIMLLVFIVSFIAFKNFETLTALRTSSFITAIIGVLFWSINLLSIEYLIFPVIILALTIFYTLVTKE